jgi:hypothetical protein
MVDIILSEEQILAISDIDVSYRQRMQEVPLPPWVDTFFWHNADSSLPVEPYPIIDGTAEWQKAAEGTSYRQDNLSVKSVLLQNDRYIKSLVVPYSYIKYDRYGLIMQEIEAQAAGVRDLWIGMIMSILNAGETSTAYDGETFFDTDHPLGSMTGQANYVEIDISTLPVEHGTGVTTPSSAELYQSVIQTISALRKIRSGTNIYPNEFYGSYHVLLPESLSGQAQAAFANENLAATMSQVMLALAGGGMRLGSNSKLNITYDCLPSLNLTDAFIVTVADTSEKPFIRQTEDFRIDSLLYDSDQFKHKDILEWPTKVYGGAGNFNWKSCAMGRMI